MSLNEMMFIGATGLETYSNAMSVVSNDIANSNTTAFKTNTVNFGDLIGGWIPTTTSQTEHAGAGVGITGTYTDWSEGSVTGTSLWSDLAVNGSGFFSVAAMNANGNATGTTYYSRDGSFSLNQNGYLVNNSGDAVLNTALNPIQVLKDPANPEYDNFSVDSTGQIYGTRIRSTDITSYNNEGTTTQTFNDPQTVTYPPEGQDMSVSVGDNGASAAQTLVLPGKTPIQYNITNILNGNTTDSVMVTILNSSGATVYSQQLSAQSAGAHSWVWDGKDSAGNSVATNTLDPLDNYTYQVTSTDALSTVKYGFNTITNQTAVTAVQNGVLAAMPGGANDALTPAAAATAAEALVTNQGGTAAMVAAAGSAASTGYTAVTNATETAAQAAAAVTAAVAVAGQYPAAYDNGVGTYGGNSIYGTSSDNTIFNASTAVGDAGGTMAATLGLPSPATAAVQYNVTTAGTGDFTVNVLDSKGNTVYTEALTGVAAGLGTFTWDGKDNVSDPLNPQPVPSNSDYTYEMAPTNPATDNTTGVVSFGFNVTANATVAAPVQALILTYMPRGAADAGSAANAATLAEAAVTAAFGVNPVVPAMVTAAGTAASAAYTAVLNGTETAAAGAAAVTTAVTSAGGYPAAYDNISDAAAIPVTTVTGNPYGGASVYAGLSDNTILNASTGADISYKLSAPSFIVYQITDSNGGVLQTINVPTPQAAGSYAGINLSQGAVQADGTQLPVPPNTPLWNGKDSSGNDVGSGSYTVNVLTAPVSGAVDTVKYNLLTPATVTYDVLNSSGTQVYTYTTPNALPAGTASFSWNGMDSNGNPVTPGAYTYSIKTSADGQTEAIANGQINLSVIPNPNGLSSEGNNLYSANSNSGSPITNAGGAGGAAGGIQDYSLESSNVDLASQLTNMIIYQEAYTANSKSITSAKELIDVTMNLVT